MLLPFSRVSNTEQLNQKNFVFARYWELPSMLGMA